ncbi:hypothetical protein E5288_WYG022808 [Bos mutus]|uniref:Uncharacterized protein n=1 Tax=Bos mutus TaxID=72004 RepID=A0A6B0R4F3_9CETA|nr:hypothetical protein [Bos mutus]
MQQWLSQRLAAGTRNHHLGDNGLHTVGWHVFVFRLERGGMLQLSPEERPLRHILDKGPDYSSELTDCFGKTHGIRRVIEGRLKSFKLSDLQTENYFKIFQEIEAFHIWSLGPALIEVTDAALPQFPLKKSNTTNLDPQRETCLKGHPSCTDMKTYGKSSCTSVGFTKKRNNQIQKTSYAQHQQVHQIRKKMMEIMT